ncbi:MAG: hypothetical protein OXC41_06690 [Gammaproteobacteria bacterium]|nr:hypothetical protein [Gammaproteobacteria bacterium]
MHTLTRHIRTRCQQRGIKERDLKLVAQFGTETPKGLILTRKDVAEVEREAKRLMNRLSRLQDVFVATEGETMKTAFRATKRQRRTLMGRW